jgi:hypothetical protein
MQVIAAQAHSTASREAVWQVVAAANDWARWGNWHAAEIRREGNPPPAGLGAVKALTANSRGLNGKRVVSVEEVTAFEPPSRFGYKLLSGLPLRDYNATITLTEASEGGTDIEWRSQFEPKYPLTGGLFRGVLGRFMKDAAQRLAREAERAD